MRRRIIEMLVELQPWEFVAGTLDHVEGETPIALLRIPNEINENEARLLCEAIWRNVIKS